jgi:energy-coupling factor transport system substrate-specific component
MIFAAFPNFKPTTAIIILAGYAFGPRAGFMVGATTAVVSNMFFMQGPWTLYQMVAWGLVGAGAGVFGRIRGKNVKSWEIALFGLVAGFFFGWIMNTWVWLSTMYPLNFQSWLLANSTSLLFDIAHATSNVLFAFLLTRPFLPILLRFQKKLTTIHLEVIPDVETETSNS